MSQIPTEIRVEQNGAELLITAQRRMKTGRIPVGRGRFPKDRHGQVDWASVEAFLTQLTDDRRPAK